MQEFSEDLSRRVELLNLKQAQLTDQLNNYRLLTSSIADLTETYRAVCSATVDPTTAHRINELKAEIRKLDVERADLKAQIQSKESDLNEQEQHALSLQQQNRALQDRVSQLAQRTETKQNELFKVERKLQTKERELSERRQQMAEHDILTQSLAEKRQKIEKAYISEIEANITELSHFYEQLCKEAKRLEQVLATFKE